MSHTELTETSDKCCGVLTAGAVCSPCGIIHFSYFFPPADFFIGSVGQEAVGLSLLVQLDWEAELPQMELVLQGKAHLAQVA